MRVKINLTDRKVFVMEEDVELKKKENIELDKKVEIIDDKYCVKCVSSEFRFNIFGDVKERCSCSILKGTFLLMDKNDCPYYNKRNDWKKRIDLAFAIGHDWLDSN